MVQDDYELLDSGCGAKLERFGSVRLVRPCAQAYWNQSLSPEMWNNVTAAFDRKKGNCWQNRSALPKSWIVQIEGIQFRLSSTDFGHLGVFPEQRAHWRRIKNTLRASEKLLGRTPTLLNLFAYSGGATLAAAQAGAEVCHLDASKGMVDWASENAVLNNLDTAPIRWIVDDVHRFLDREIRRGRRYDAIVLDPPTFGRGAKDEIYRIEHDLIQTLTRCRALLSDQPLFVLLSCHTPLCTPGVLVNLLSQVMPPGDNMGFDSGEMMLTGAECVMPLPNGVYAFWGRNDFLKGQA